MKVTLNIDIEAAKEYMAHAADKRVENLPLWVALSICLGTNKRVEDLPLWAALSLCTAEYKRQMEPKTSTKDLIDEFIRKELKGDTDGQS